MTKLKILMSVLFLVMAFMFTVIPVPLFRPVAFHPNLSVVVASPVTGTVVISFMWRAHPMASRVVVRTSAGFPFFIYPYMYRGGLRWPYNYRNRWTYFYIYLCRC